MIRVEYVGAHATNRDEDSTLTRITSLEGAVTNLNVDLFKNKDHPPLGGEPYDLGVWSNHSCDPKSHFVSDS